jgi:NAD(P)-dependent dehydrogenase (short-subunit alcohol dehydrogenase family)
MKKIQVITGGASGMGLATAKELGEYGPVLIGDRTVSKIDRALEELKAAGVEAYGKPCDVFILSSVQDFAKAATDIAPIGNVVNAAGLFADQANSKTY